jgi:hypothetical protein
MIFTFVQIPINKAIEAFIDNLLFDARVKLGTVF